MFIQYMVHYINCALSRHRRQPSIDRKYTHKYKVVIETTLSRGVPAPAAPLADTPIGSS